MANEDITVTVGAIRELTDDEKKARDISKGLPVSGLNVEGDQQKELHRNAVKISKLGDNSHLFDTSDIKLPVVGQQELTYETKTTTTTSPRSELKGEPEVPFKLKLLVDWHDGQGILHQHGEVIEVPHNEATRLLNERRAQRAEPIAEEFKADPGQYLIDDEVSAAGGKVTQTKAVRASK